MAAIVLGGFLGNSFGLGIGQQKEDGGTPGMFLNYAASPRSLGMGRAYTAIADDAGATYWNPSGLSRILRADLLISYSSLEENTNFSFLSYAQPFYRQGTFALSMVSLRSSNYEKRTETMEKAGTAGLSETAFLLSHGMNLNRWCSIGTTLKAVRQDIDTYSSNGYGLDFGSMFRVGQRWQFGAMARNLVAPQLKLKSSSESLSRNYSVGAKWIPKQRLTLSTDLNKAENSAPKINFGMEWRPVPLLSLRTGFNSSAITMGLGIQMGDWGFDYGLGLINSEAGSGSNNSQFFGLHLNFGPNVLLVEEARLSKIWRERGQIALLNLRRAMQENGLNNKSSFKNDFLINEANEVIQHLGFPKPKELYEAQGYAYFLEKKYDRSAQCLSDALTLGRGGIADLELRANHQKAIAKLNTESRLAIIKEQLKIANGTFEIGKFKDTINACQRILAIDPVHMEATQLLQTAQEQLNSPVLKIIKSAEMKIEMGQHLDAIKDLYKAQKLDPENKEASILIQLALNSLDKIQANANQERVVQEVTLNQTQSRALYMKGLVYYSKGNLQEAVVFFQDSIKNNPLNIQARNAYGQVLREINNPDAY